MPGQKWWIVNNFLPFQSDTKCYSDSDELWDRSTAKPQIKFWYSPQTDYNSMFNITRSLATIRLFWAILSFFSALWPPPAITTSFIWKPYKLCERLKPHRQSAAPTILTRDNKHLAFSTEDLSAWPWHSRPQWHHRPVWTVWEIPLRFPHVCLWKMTPGPRELPQKKKHFFIADHQQDEDPPHTRRKSLRWLKSVSVTSCSDPLRF